MSWKNVNHSLPKPYEVVWIYWRDREVTLGCRIYYEEDAINCHPSEGWYSFDYDKCRWTLWWMYVKESLDKPNPPEMKNINR